MFLQYLMQIILITILVLVLGMKTDSWHRTAITLTLQVKERWDKSLFCLFSKHRFNSFAASLKVRHASAPLCFQINRLLCSTSSYKERFGTIWRLIDLVPCTIEEADQGIFLYVKKSSSTK